jgi:hypothetical protein
MRSETSPHAQAGPHESKVSVGGRGEKEMKCRWVTVHAATCNCYCYSRHAACSAEVVTDHGHSEWPLHKLCAVRKWQLRELMGRTRRMVQQWLRTLKLVSWRRINPPGRGPYMHAAVFVCLFGLRRTRTIRSNETTDYILGNVDMDPSFPAGRGMESYGVDKEITWWRHAPGIEPRQM